jgi:hypothetical protein
MNNEQPSYSIDKALNGFIVRKSWYEKEIGYQSEQTIFNTWSDMAAWIMDNPY